MQFKQEGKKNWWLPYKDQSGNDLRGLLKDMGFKIAAISGYWCEVVPPKGWDVEEAETLDDLISEAYVTDKKGNRRLHCHSDEADGYDPDPADLAWIAVMPKE